MAHFAGKEEIGDDGAIIVRPEIGTADNARLIVGIVISFSGIRAAMKLGEWLFAIHIMDSVLIFGIGIAVYVFFHAIANRKSNEKRGHVAFSLAGFMIAVAITIALCGLSRVVPFLRS